MPLSIVTRASKPASSISFRSSPFFLPRQPRRATVSISKPSPKDRPSRQSSCSSSRTRKARGLLYGPGGHLEVGHRPLPAHGRDRLKEPLQRIAGGQILYEHLHGHTGAREHQRPVHHLRVARNYLRRLHALPTYVYQLRLRHATPPIDRKPATLNLPGATRTVMLARNDRFREEPFS